MDTKRIYAAAGGAVGTAADIGALVLLVEKAHVAVPVAAFAAATVGAAVCFVANKYVAFRDRTPVTFKQLGTFAFVAFATALLMALAMNVLAVKLGVPYLLAKLVSAAAIFAVWTYPAQRRFVFKTPALAQ